MACRGGASTASSPRPPLRAAAGGLRCVAPAEWL